MAEPAQFPDWLITGLASLDKGRGLLKEGAANDQHALKALRDTVVSLRSQLNEAEEEIEALTARLRACEEQPPPPEPPAPGPLRMDYNRTRWVWATELEKNLLTERLRGIGADTAGVVVRADLPNRSWYHEVEPFLLREPPLSIAAYIRAPVHAAYPKDGWLPPYEGCIWEILTDTKAVTQNLHGNPVFRTPYDVDLTAWEVDLERHADLTAEAVAAGPFTHILADGLTTWQLYTKDPFGADFDRDGVADHTVNGFEALAGSQYQALRAWVSHLRKELSKRELSAVKIIGNGAWEPTGANLTPRQGPNGTPLRWELLSGPPGPSRWLDVLDGAMIEDPSWPGYFRGNPAAQYPLLSQNLWLMVMCALQWTGAGKAFLWGGGFEQLGIDDTPERLIALQRGLSLLTDAHYIAPVAAPLALVDSDGVSPSRPVASPPAGGNIYREYITGDSEFYRWFGAGDRCINVDPKRGGEGAYWMDRPRPMREV